ncbi:MAG: hypothetical protein ACK5X0_07495, partial [Rhodospirillales bacterium]
DHHRQHQQPSKTHDNDVALFVTAANRADHIDDTTVFFVRLPDALSAEVIATGVISITLDMNQS